MPRSSRGLAVFFIVFSSLILSATAFAATTSPLEKSTLWELVSAGGTVMIFLALMSVAATASVIYHYRFVRPELLTPRDFSENLLFLLEKKEYDKAVTVCKQQSNLISAIALKGLQKMSKGKAVVESAIQYEGKARIERMWQNLTYLGDMAVIAPMLGLLGTIFGMIDAFGYFKAESLNPAVLTQGLAKAMINTAMGLVIAVPALMFYSYFRGRLSTITSTAETVSSEIAQILAKSSLTKE